MLPSNNLSSVPVFDFSAGDLSVLTGACEDLAALDSKKLVEAVFDAGSVLEIQKDFGKRCFAGLARWRAFTVALLQQGRRFCANMCAKAARFDVDLRRVPVPVVTFVDSEAL
jgi:acetyl-CoA carboxylase carboxyltransferase component